MKHGKSERKMARNQYSGMMSMGIKPIKNQRKAKYLADIREDYNNESPLTKSNKSKGGSFYYYIALLDKLQFFKKTCLQKNFMIKYN